MKNTRSEVRFGHNGEERQQRNPNQSLLLIPVHHNAAHLSRAGMRGREGELGPPVPAALWAYTFMVLGHQVQLKETSWER